MSNLKSLQRLLVVQAIYEISINKERIKEGTEEILRDIIQNLDLGNRGSSFSGERVEWSSVSE